MACIFHSCVYQVGLVSLVRMWSGVDRSSLHWFTICGPCWTPTHCWLIQGLQGTGNLLPHLCSFCLFTTNVGIVSPIRERGGCDESSCLLVWLFWWRGSNLNVCYPMPYVNQWLAVSSAQDHVCQQQCVIEVACLGLPALKAEIEVRFFLSFCLFVHIQHSETNHSLEQSFIPYPPSPLLILQQTGLYFTL